jgi:hypothetical protein
MTLVSRLVVVGWMVGGLFGAALAVAVPAFLVYGVAIWSTGSGAHLRWLEVGLGWTMRIGLCAAIWWLGKRAAVAGGPQAPSGSTIALTALAGIAIGLLVGTAVRDSWGLQIVSAAGLPAESFLDDIVTGVALLGYALATFGATFVPRKRVAVV